jgi:two-component system, OmpR family, sensor histidine kinase KdpD
MINVARPSAESPLAKLKADERAKLRVYIGAAPGVGKTYQMLEAAHELKQQGVDIMIGIIDTHGREKLQLLSAISNKFRCGLPRTT